MMNQDPWHFPRGELAAHLLKVMESGLASRIAIFAPRRKGKTWFVLRDLAPAAVNQGYIPVFASLWSNPDKPHMAIADGVQTATDALKKRRVPWSDYLSKLASVGVNLGGMGGSLGIVPAKTPSADELSALSESLNTLVAIAGKKKRRVLLLIDEAQHLATRPAFESLAKSLRTAMEGIEATKPDAIRTLFTGSSRTDLAALLDHRNAAFYGSFENHDLPDFSADYTNFVARQLKRLGRITVDPDDLWDTFSTFDTSPYYLQQVIRELMLHRAANLEESRRMVMENIVNNPELAARWRALTTLEQLVFQRVGESDTLYTNEAIKILEDQLKQQMAPDIAEALETSKVQGAVRRLSKKGLISSQGRGAYRNEDPELLAWTRYRKP